MSDRFGYGEIGLGIESGENDKHPSNADRIRAMTDDELTRFFAENCGCGDWCMHHRSGACANKPENECCLDVWHKWLKSSAR